MSRLTLRLPKTLHQQLAHLAEGERVSLNQYIVYTLTRQISQSYTVHKIALEEVNQQEQAFKTLLQELGKTTESDIQAVLAQRDNISPEPELSPKIIANFQQKIRNIVKV